MSDLKVLTYNNIILDCGEVYHYGVANDTFFPHLPNKPNQYPDYSGVIFFQPNLGHGLKDQVLYDVELIPEEVTVPYDKWCYTEADGFYLNPDWHEPNPYASQGVNDETYNAIYDDAVLAILETI